VVLTDELFGPDRHPDLPDILIRFRTDLGMITACESPRVGRVQLIRRSHRTGEHGTPGAVWMYGPGVPAGTSLGDVRTVDLAPTVLAGLGLGIPEWVDGAPLPIAG
jgi:predicted AlkP superfamily phosphohydrolase/phosphomutase